MTEEVSESTDEKNGQNQEALDPQAKLELELKDYKDKYFRTLAEMENSRKRLQKEKLESQTFAIQNVVVDFLQPMDHFEQALKASENSTNEIKQWVIGFQMILNQLKQVLQDNGVTAFESVGNQFDPHLHEAIETEETTEIPEGTITYEFLRGYKMGNRVIRPSRVKVAVLPASENNNS
jgi:molecular chaperone GrpE